MNESNRRAAEAIEAELEAQNEIFKELCATLGALGAVELPISVDELDALTGECELDRTSETDHPMVGIRC
jgi:hypothetical protein